MSQSTLSTQDEQLAAAAMTLQATDTTPPDVPGGPGYIIIDGATDDAGAKQGEVLNNGFTDDLTPVLHGHIEHGQNMELMIYANTQFLGTVKTDGNGNWSFDPQLLDHSQYTFEVLAKDPGGSRVMTSMPFMITTTDINHDYQTPTITSVVNDSGTDPVNLTNGESTNDATPVLTGTADANQTVYLYDGNERIASVVANANGVWTFTPPAALSEGVHILSATEAMNGSETNHSSNFVLFIEASTPEMATNITLFDDFGDKTGEIFNGDYTDDRNPTLSGQAEVGDTLIINDKGEYLGSVVVGLNGTWSYTPEDALSFGEHSFTTIVEDTVHNLKSPESEAIGFTVIPQYATYSIADMLQSDQVHNNEYIGDKFTITSENTIKHFDGDAASYPGIALLNATPTSSMTVNFDHPVTNVSFYISGLRNDQGGSRVVLWDTHGNKIIDTMVTNPGNDHGNFFSYDAPAGVEIDHCQIYGDNCDGGITVNSLVFNTISPFDPSSDQVGQTNNNVHDALQSGISDLEYPGHNYIMHSNTSISHYGGDSLSFSGIAVPGGTDKYANFQFNEAVDDVSVRISGLDSSSRVVVHGSHGETLYDAYVTADGISTNKQGDYTTFHFDAPEGKTISELVVYSDGNGVTLDELSFNYHEAVPEPVAASDTHEQITDNLTAQDDTQSVLTQNAVIDLHETTQHMQSISHDDILSHAQQNMFINDGKQQLAIQGDKGDVVELKGEDLAASTWTDTGHSTVAGVTYEVYQHTGDNLELLVQQGVELQHS